MISIIIPVYNAEKYLKESLDTIINQTYKNLEIIIINDGSTDKSDEIIKLFLGDKRIVYISRDNRGLVKTINEGLRVAKGAYIARMDADDISALDRLEKQVKFLEKNEVDLCGCLYGYIGDATEMDIEKLNGEFDIIKKLESNELVICAGHSVCHPSFLFKRAILNEVGFYDENFEIAEDLAFQLKFLENNKKIKVLNENLYSVRKHNMSKSALENIDNALETMKLRTDYIMGNLISKDSKILIWACGSGGQNLYDYITKNYKNIKVKGFIDSNSFGSVVKGIEVFSPDKLNDLEFDYIFIATSPGKVEVQKILNLQGYTVLNDYFSIYT